MNVKTDSVHIYRNGINVKRMAERGYYFHESFFGSFVKQQKEKLFFYGFDEKTRRSEIKKRKWFRTFHNKKKTE